MTAPAPITDARAYLQRLAELLTAEELADLVRALEAIKDQSGFGNIQIEMKRGRIDKIWFGASLKPGVIK